METIAEIKLRVSLDEERKPVRIEWDAEEAGEPGWKPCHAFLLSVWDSEEGNALNIDLWTEELRVEEMTWLAAQSVLRLADTYRDATNGGPLCEMLDRFAEEIVVRFDLQETDPDEPAEE